MHRNQADEGWSYRIRVQGELDENWSDWFSGLTITVQTGGEGGPVTTLRGVVADQAVLRGILSKIWDLNLTLISVEQVEQGTSDLRSDDVLGCPQDAPQA
jgi:hypothetical protein